MKIYIVRHGQTQWNVQKRMQGWGNSNLTELGVKQTRLLGEALIDVDFKAVVSSPLGRTLETTKHILKNRDLEIIVNENFKEMGFGSWEGIEPHVLKEIDKDRYENFWKSAHLYVPTDGESFEDVNKRILKGLSELISNYSGNPNNNILLVTHGMIIKLLLLHIKGLPLERLWDTPVVHASCLTIIEIDEDNNIKIILENDIGHLGDK